VPAKEKTAGREWGGKQKYDERKSRHLATFNDKDEKE